MSTYTKSPKMHNTKKKKSTQVKKLINIYDNSQKCWNFTKNTWNLIEMH